MTLQHYSYFGTTLLKGCRPLFYTVVFQVFLEVFQLYTFYYIMRFTRATIYSFYIKIYLHYPIRLSIIAIYIYIYICGWFLRKQWLLFSPLVVTATHDTDENLFAVFSPECSAVVSFMMAFLCSAEMTA